MQLDTNSKRFPGYVIIPDEFGWPETMAAWQMIRELDGMEMEQSFFAMLPGLIKIVQEWHVEGWPEHPVEPEDIPCKPFPEVAQVLSRIQGEVFRKANETSDVPLASSPTPTQPQPETK